MKNIATMQAAASASVMIQPSVIDTWLAMFKDRTGKKEHSVVGMTCWNMFG